MKYVAVFDDKCDVCNLYVSGGKRGKIIPIGYSTADAKKLMRAQFKKNYGFTLMLFKDKEVLWGTAAAEELSRIAYSSWLKNIMHLFYPFIVASLNIILRRKTLPSPPSIRGKKLPASGGMPLTKEASEQLSHFFE